MHKVLVTGATGFVGRHLCRLLRKSGHEVIGAARSMPPEHKALDYELRVVGDIGEAIDWEPVLDGVDSIVHLAARVHVMDEHESDPLAEYRRVNVAGMARLLRSASIRDVKRVVYLSTAKVLGESTAETPFSADDAPAPMDPYSQSKLEAERELEQIGADMGFDTVIIRPPLVYGPGVGGNFLRIMRLVDKGIPLPLAGIKNRRSLVGVENLCDLVRECLVNPAAAGKRLLVSDNADMSTPGLIRLIAALMGRSPRLFPVPGKLLGLAAKLTGRSTEVSRLMGSLHVDIAETMRALDWQPPVTVEKGVSATVKWYEAQRS
jgi:nucleoside-diphosphate-sugar epimerase